MRNNYKEKIQMKFTVNQLERIIVAILNNVNNKKFINNVERLFSLFSEEFYKNDYEKEYRVYLIKELTKVITKNKFDNRDALLSSLDLDGKYNLDSIALLNNLSDMNIPENELIALDRNISNQLRYNSVMNDSEELVDMLTNLQAENYSDLEEFMSGMETKLQTMNKNLKESRESIENEKNDMNLSDSAFVNYLGKLIKKERNPANKVKLGLQYLNVMFNGGLERGRCYCALGVAKGWKSGFLLNAASWAKRYNTFTTHDPKLKPCIVYLSMENTNEETIKRLWAHCFGNESDISNYDEVTAANMLENAGLFTPNDANAPEIVIWYRPNKSISTADLNNMLEDLKRNGQECCLLILDYVKRIRPVEASKELRIELSNITNELKTIAMEQDIPILTAMQLNREAFKTLEDADSFDEKIRASDKLGASNIGESIDIIQNVDYAFIVNKMQKRSINEEGETEYADRYLFVKLIACRSKQPPIVSFKHRFKDDNDMALIEDINLPRPVSTSTEVDMIKDRIDKNGQRSKGPRSIC